MTEYPSMPSGLRERVLTASGQAGAAGRPVDGAGVISPAEGFIRATDALHGLLCALSLHDWRTPVLRDLDAQGLVGHLIGVERDVHRCLTGHPGVAGADHVESTQPAADRQAGRPPAQTRAEWRRAVSRTLSLVQMCDPGDPVALHGMRLPLGALLIVRAFELWTHDNDIRRATGRPPSVPDAPTLRLMTGLAAELLPHGAALAGLKEPVSVRLVLTGPGGGAWDIRMGEGAAAGADVRIVTGAVGFCQLVANRVAPWDLDLDITGDREQADGVLAAVAALALD